MGIVIYLIGVGLCTLLLDIATKNEPRGYGDYLLKAIILFCSWIGVMATLWVILTENKLGD